MRDNHLCCPMMGEVSLEKEPLFIYLFVYLFIYLSIYLFTCYSIYIMKS